MTLVGYSEIGAFEQWYRDTSKEQHCEESIFPPAMEDKEAVNLLIRYLLPDGWYTALPVGRGQVTAIAVESILGQYSKRYRRERERTRRRGHEQAEQC